MKTLKIILSFLIWGIFWLEMMIIFPIILFLSFIIPFKSFHNIIVKLFCTIITYSCMLFPRVKYLSEEVKNMFPVIYVANHVSFFDIFISGAILKGYPRGIELESHFKTPFYGWFITKFGQIPINPTNRQSVLKAIRIASDKLEKKERNLFVMPEGTRTRNGNIGKFNNGAFYISFESGYPVVPVIFLNLFERNNPTSLMINPGIVKVLIGKPFYPSDFKSKEEMQEKVREYMIEILQNKEKL